MINWNGKKVYQFGQHSSYAGITSRYKYVSLEALFVFKNITSEVTIEKYEEATLKLHFIGSYVIKLCNQKYVICMFRG